MKLSKRIISTCANANDIANRKTLIYFDVYARKKNYATFSSFDSVIIQRDFNERAKNRYYWRGGREREKRMVGTS